MLTKQWRQRHRILLSLLHWISAFWRQLWTKCLKCKLWNLSFPLLAVSVETMLTLSDKPSTSYRSHLRDPKTVLEYPKLPLSRLSDVIKWQAPLKHRQADGRTNMPCLRSLSSAWLWQAVGWYGVVWLRADYPFKPADLSNERPDLAKTKCILLVASLH